jgi:hypothetical protein
MKQCNRCLELKPLEEFQKRAKNKDGHTYMCKVCKRAYDNAHYKENPERRMYIRANSDNRIRIVREWLMDYLKSHPCVDCGNDEIVVLEFDHRGDKEANVGDLMRSGNLATVQREVAKCDVRCANCHRRKTANDHGSWRLASLV